MNKVYNYLGMFRNSCMLKYFGNSYDRYVGLDEQLLKEKRFAEYFIKNSIFEPGNELHEIAVQYMSNKTRDNLVKIFAEKLYNFIIKYEEMYVGYGANKDFFEYPNPNFKIIKDATAVLSVLRRHFTYNKCTVFTDLETDCYTVSPTIENPATSWNFIDVSLINDRLGFKDNFPFNCQKIYSYDFNNDAIIRRFFSWLNIHRSSSCKGTIIFSQKAIDTLISTIKKSKMTHKNIKTKNKLVTMSFDFCCNASKIDQAQCNVTLSFRRNSGNYYTLVISKIDCFVFDFIKNQESLCAQTIYCAQKHQKYFENAMRYSDYTVSLFDTDRVLIFE